MTDLLPANAYRTVALAQGTVRYYDAGDGPPILFVHGLLVNSNLWRKVIPTLLPHARCIAPDLPLGGHTIPLHANAERGPHAVAAMLADLMDALDLQDVTLVGNDTGGAICQLLMTTRPERLGRVLLTNCDAYEAFFPAAFNWLATFARRGPGFVDLLARALHTTIAQRLLLVPAMRTTPSATLRHSYVGGLTNDAGIRRDLHGFLARVSNRDTLAAAEQFPGFTKPVRLVWSTDDLLFRPRLARRLAADLPNAKVEFIRGARAFVSEDRPDAVIAALRQMLPHQEPVAVL